MEWKVADEREPVKELFPQSRLLRSFSYLVLAAQTSGTQIEPLRLTTYNNSGRVNIGYPAPIGMVLGMTDIMTELR